MLKNQHLNKKSHFKMMFKDSKQPDERQGVNPNETLDDISVGIFAFCKQAFII